MSKNEPVVVVGLGEVGKPLFELASKYQVAVGVDVEPPAERIDRAQVLHICYPFQIGDFVAESARYIKLFNPELTIIHSTVAVGTTRAVAMEASRAVVYSPVRGKHAKMIDDLQRYTKFVGAMTQESGRLAADHLESLGLKTKVMSSPEATELAKLTETTYFGLLIAWAQEVERYCDAHGQRYEEVIAFYKEIGYLPPVDFFPGAIGGHCVMPNIEILSKVHHSEILQAIKSSNRKKVEREARGRAMSGEVTEPGSASALRISRAV